MQRLNTPFVNLFIVIFIYGVYLFFLLTKLNFDLTYLISLGKNFVNFNLLPSKITIAKNDGYDGQFYYRLALNPFTSVKEEFGINLDLPAYRQQRIFYPLITWIISLGNKSLIPFILLGINFFAISLIGLVGAYYAKAFKLHAFWGLLFAIYPGFLYTLSRDLTEILQALFLLTTLLFIKKGKYLFASLALTLAILTRETALVVAISLVFTAKSRYFLIPVLTYLIWQVILGLNWGVFPILIGNVNISLSHPFSGIIPYFQNMLILFTKGNKLGFIQLCFLLVFTVAVFNAFKSSKDEVYKRISFCIYTLMAVCYTPLIWVMDITFFRALTELYIIGSAILISSKSKLIPLIFLMTVIMWLFSFNLFAYY